MNDEQKQLKNNPFQPTAAVPLSPLHIFANDSPISMSLTNKQINSLEKQLYSVIYSNDIFGHLSIHNKLTFATYVSNIICPELVLYLKANADKGELQAIEGESTRRCSICNSIIPDKRRE